MQSQMQFAFSIHMIFPIWLVSVTLVGFMGNALIYIVLFSCLGTLLSPLDHPQIPVTYPATSPEIALPELDGKTAKMYRGGKICLSDHFKPLWGRNVPKFGIAHAMALGVSYIYASRKF